MRRLCPDSGEGRFLDMDTASDLPVTWERLVARRQEIYDIFRYAFLSDVVAMTPGYIGPGSIPDSPLLAGLELRNKPRVPIGYVAFKIEASRTVLETSHDNRHDPRAKAGHNLRFVTTSPIPLRHDVPRPGHPHCKPFLKIGSPGSLPHAADIARGGVHLFPFLRERMLSDSGPRLEANGSHPADLRPKVS